MSEFVTTDDIDWSDIEAIPQDDGPNPLVVIQYSADYRRLMDLFRGVIKAGDLSERVITLTAELLAENPANYTVWQYRRDCLRALKSDLTKEFEFMDAFAKENPKNYQIWHHRRTIVEMSNDPSRELLFCHLVFEVDAKNYHAWAHRQWVIKTFHIWQEELSYVETLLDNDIRNNSAWNQRWFVVHQGPEPITEAILRRELDYCVASIEKASLNESAWNYLRGLNQAHTSLSAAIKAVCQRIVEASENSHILALSLLADIEESESNAESLKEAVNHFSLLSDLDQVRRKFWLRRVEEAQGIIAQG